MWKYTYGLYNTPSFDFGIELPGWCCECKEESMHLYMHKDDSSAQNEDNGHDGRALWEKVNCDVWIWCSNCHVFIKERCRAPFFWKNPPFIDYSEAGDTPEYLDKYAEELDNWAKNLCEKAGMYDKSAAKCSLCGTTMEPRTGKNEAGMECPACHWGYVSYIPDPIAADQTIYQIILSENNQACQNTLKIISHITMQNYLQTKKLIESAPAVLFTEKATKVREICAMLAQNNIEYTIIPDFPYEIEPAALPQ
ncbi:MAG: hypothetical protein K6G50_08525 [bacterium]|nr:hypothetical protein [bacterium]